MSQAEEVLLITACSTTASSRCPDCQQVSSRVHSTYLHAPQTLPSSGRPVRLLLRVLGEAMGGEAGARLSQKLAMACSPATLLRLVRQSVLPSSAHVRVIGVDEWAWRKGLRYGTIVVDLERQRPIDLLADASAESFVAWLQAHPSVQIISRDRGTTSADGARRGAPQALQIADRWHVLQNLGEALEKVLTRHHADLKRTFAPQEEDQLIPPSMPKSLPQTAVSQAEQARRAREERRRTIFSQVQELSAQGWPGASIARMLGIHKKTAVKYAAADHLPEARSDRGRKFDPYLPYLQARWAAGEHTIALLYQTIRSHGYSGSETSVRQYVNALREEIGPPRRLRREYPPVSMQRKRQQRAALSSRRANWLVLRRPEQLASEEQQMIDLVKQAHPQVRVACELAQAFVQMIRGRDASALESWMQETPQGGVPELKTFAAGIKRDQPAVLAALTHEWSQGRVEGQIHRLKLLKRQSYGQAGFDLLRHRVLARTS